MPRAFSGLQLRKNRELVGLSRRQLAAAINRSASTVESYELGRAEPPSEILGLLVEVLHLAGVDALFTPATEESFDLEKAIQAAVDAAPPLTAEQRVRLTALLVGAR